MSIFKKATKENVFLNMGLCGPSGSGKTFSALSIAKHFGKVAFLDTENGSAEKYSDIFDFDVVRMKAPYHPDRLCQVIAEAEKEKYDIIIIDSLSHFWSGEGGILSILNEYAKKAGTSNTFSQWSKVSKIQTRTIEFIQCSKIHTICAIRAKQKYTVEDSENKGRIAKIKRKLGLDPIQRDGIDYEFDVFGMLDHEHTLKMDKCRCHMLSDRLFPLPGEEIAKTLIDWLSAESPVANEPQPVLHTYHEKPEDKIEGADEGYSPEMKKALKTIEYFKDNYGMDERELIDYTGKFYQQWTDEDYEKLKELKRQLDLESKVKETFQAEEVNE